MIDILYNKLGSINDAKSAEWKDIDVSIYNRHSQLPQLSLLKEAKVHDSIIVEPSQLKQTLANASLLTSAPAPAPVPVPSKKKEGTITKGKKDTTIKPLDVIMKETTSFNISTEYIKESIITLISKEEFSKVFGLTKCAEIMSGIVNNRWNKSTALFISFLFDREVYYNEKSILYNKDNKDKNGGVITI